MDIVNLQWRGPFDLGVNGWNSDPAFDESKGLYMLLDSHVNRRTTYWVHRLIYIGQAYHQTFGERIAQHKDDAVGRWIAKNVRGTLTGKLAGVELVTQSAISQSLVDDTENLLIFTQQPPANIQGKEGYNGRRLKVSNHGRHNPLLESIATSNFARL